MDKTNLAGSLRGSGRFFSTRSFFVLSQPTLEREVILKAKVNIGYPFGLNPFRSQLPNLVHCTLQKTLWRPHFRTNFFRFGLGGKLGLLLFDGKGKNGDVNHCCLQMTGTGPYHFIF